jgi:hypothetical protein
LEEQKQRHYEQIKKWPNTLENIRKKREEDKLKQLEEEEMRKREQDREMEEEAEARRQEALEKANKNMHD